mmetsp:Transcript_15235/g.51338  ORF Transcript_15235/g.51338 Transcript_15235/m.51338 type:complete len:287 (+) Transcript_15235:148-1008(+)
MHLTSWERIAILTWSSCKGSRMAVKPGENLGSGQTAMKTALGHSLRGVKRLLRDDGHLLLSEHQRPIDVGVNLAQRILSSRSVELDVSLQPKNADSVVHVKMRDEGRSFIPWVVRLRPDHRDRSLFSPFLAGNGMGMKAESKDRGARQFVLVVQPSHESPSPAQPVASLAPEHSQVETNPRQGVKHHGGSIAGEADGVLRRRQAERVDRVRGHPAEKISKLLLISWRREGIGGHKALLVGERQFHSIPAEPERAGSMAKVASNPRPLGHAAVKLVLVIVGACWRLQ